MDPVVLPVRWKGALYELRVCYSSEQAAELLARWPDGVIELSQIFDHESPSSERARAWIVRSVFAAANTPIPAEPANLAFASLAERRATEIAAVKRVLAAAQL